MCAAEGNDHHRQVAIIRDPTGDKPIQRQMVVQPIDLEYWPELRLRSGPILFGTAFDEVATKVKKIPRAL